MTAAPHVEWRPSSRSNPCPICGREKDGDCRIGPEQVLCHYGSSHHPPEGLKPGDVIERGGQRWAFTGDTANGLWAKYILDRPQSAVRKGGRQPVAGNPGHAQTAGILEVEPTAPPSAGAENVWRYSSTFYVYRFPGKQIRPRTWSGTTWEWKAPKGARPLLLSHPLEERPDSSVLVVEGEKAWEAAQRLFPQVICCTWSGGCKALKRTTWTPLAGRKVVLWPDNDEPGRQAMAQLAEILYRAGAATVLMVSNPPDARQGWDLADADWTPEQAAAWAKENKTQVESPPTPTAPMRLVEVTPQAGDDGENRPYRVLGWCAERKQIWYQHRQTGQIASIKPTATAGPLLQLAPIGWWESFHYKGKDGIDWPGACSEVIEAANTAGVFAPERIRGRGVWMEGERVIWHLGDRLEVDGVEIGLADHRSANYYACLPTLAVDRTVAPLSDAEGQRILSAVEAMGWSTPLDHLHLLGWAVLANVGGALEKRPVLQLTSKFGSGKTYTRERVLEPLLAGLAISRSNSSEAGIRQLLRADTLPVLIDESEGEDHGRREGHLRLARLSYDGSPTDRGTTHGQAISYAVRSSVAMVGINTTITNPADRSRTVVVGRQQLEQAQWADVDRQVRELLTAETGARLLRRAVNHVPILRANVATFRRVVEGQLRRGAAARAGDTYGALLAGAHLLVSTAAVDDAQALDWLDSIDWSAGLALGEAGAEEQDSTAESRQCLEHLLSHEEQWRSDTGTGRVTIRELVELARTPSGAEDAEQARKALGRRGIRATDTGLAIANTAEALAPIYGKTKWRDGGHRARLLDLEGAYAAGMVRFPVLGLARACTVSWEVLA